MTISNLVLVVIFGVGLTLAALVVLAIWGLCSLVIRRLRSSADPE